jgi:hypothetical protein
MIKKFIDFKLLESTQPKQHILIYESLLDLIDSGLIKEGVLLFEQNEFYIKKRLEYRFNLELRNKDISYFKELFESLETAILRSSSEYQINLRNESISFFIDTNKSLENFIKNCSVDYDYATVYPIGLKLTDNTIDIDQDININFNEEEFNDDFIYFKGYLSENLSYHDKDLLEKQINHLKEKLNEVGAYDIYIEKDPPSNKYSEVNLKMKIY